MQLSVKQVFNADVAASGKQLPDVILIHGTGANADMWQPQVDALVDRGYRCYLPELRGHGETHEPGEETDLGVHLQDILDTIEHLDINFPCVFMGHSLGAIISLMLAEQRPELFERILAVGLPGKVFSPLADAFRWFLGWPYEAIKGSFVHDKLPWRERTLINTELHTLEQIVLNFQHLDFVSRPFKVSCPVHFAVGRFDPVAPFFYVIQMHKQLPGSTLHIFEFAGHNCMDEWPDKFNKWMFQKLKEQPQEAAQVEPAYET